MLDNIKISISPDGTQTNELVIREGAALPAREEKKIEIIGTVSAPAEWYAKRASQVDPNKCHLTFSYHSLFINLQVDDKNHFGTFIRGILKTNPEMDKFGINSDSKKYTVKDLKEFLKRARYFFADPDENMKIVSNLERFRASVNTEIEKHRTDRGEKRELVDVKVDSNLDLAFTLNMPIFLGRPACKFKVDICFDVRDTNITVWLDSAELQHLFLSERDSIINENLKPFMEKFVVIEQ